MADLLTQESGDELLTEDSSDLLLESDTPALGTSPALNIRELPPLRLHLQATAPNGNSFRWGQDERRPENVYSGLGFTTTIPGGFETMDCNLPRKASVNYQDLTRLSTVKAIGAGGRVAAEHRLEKTPRLTSDSERSINPQLVGWQAHLDDDSEAAEVYVDRDLSHWGAASRGHKIALYGIGVNVQADPSVSPDTTSGIPALVLSFQGTGTSISLWAQGWYDAGPGASIGSIYYDMTSQSTVSGDVAQIGSSSDDLATATSTSADLLTGTNSSASGTFTPSPTTYRFARAFFNSSSAVEADHAVIWRRLTIWGAHGLTKQGTAPNDGLYASDVIANAVSRWAPLLNFTTGANGTIKPSAFIIPQLEFREMTTVAEILTQANRFSLNDWAVWEGKTLYYNERGARGRKWRARVAPAKLTETGPQVDRLWNGVIVRFSDVDGTTKTVGPTGALTDTTDAVLLDTDPLNPVNQLGIKRYTVLDMGIVSKIEAATEVGRQFLVRAKDLDQSGSAEIVGHCQDDRGVMHPSWAVRAGDQISFTDASDTSYRRIVKTSYDHDSRTNSLDLDSPPEGLDSLLEQLSVSLFGGTPPPTSVNTQTSASGVQTISLG